MSPLPCALTHLRQSYVPSTPLHAKYAKLVEFFHISLKRIPWKQRVTGSVIPFTTVPRHYSANVSIPLFPPPSNPSHIPSAIVVVNTLPYCPQKFMVQRSMSPLPCTLTHPKQTHVLHVKHTRLVQIYNVSSVQTTCHWFHLTIHYNFRALEEEFATTVPCFHLILPSSLYSFIHSFATCSGRQHSILPTGKKFIPTFPLCLPLDMHHLATYVCCMSPYCNKETIVLQVHYNYKEATTCAQQ